MTEVDQLSKEQFEALYEIRRRGGADEVEIVDKDAVERVREVLGEALKERGLADPSTLSLEALASQFQDDDGEVDLLVGTPEGDLLQHPETGGEALAEESEPEGIEALSAEDRAEVADRLERAEKFDDRIPKHCESLRQEAIDMVPGAETIDDIDTDRL